jgi:hypothetical protein
MFFYTENLHSREMTHTVLMLAWESVLAENSHSRVGAPPSCYVLMIGPWSIVEDITIFIYGTVYSQLVYSHNSTFFN